MSQQTKPGSIADIKAVRGELLRWIDRQPQPVRDAAGQVVMGLSAALIGTKPSSAVVAMLAEDVAKLDATRTDQRRSRQCGNGW